MKTDTQMVQMLEEVAKKRVTAEEDITFSAFIKDKDKVMVFVFVFEGDEEKDLAKKALNKLIKMIKPDQYWTVMEAWFIKQDIKEKTPNTPYIRPSRSVDRKEAIIITQFNQDNTLMLKIIPFKRKDGVTFEKPEIIETESEKCPTEWNAYTDINVAKKIINDKIRNDDKAFFDNTMKLMKDKYSEDFSSAKTSKEMLEIMIKVENDLIDIRSDIDKKIYEAPEVEDE